MFKKIKQKLNNFIGELESIQTSQMVITELKNTIFALKNLIIGFNSRKQD